MDSPVAPSLPNEILTDIMKRSVDENEGVALQFAPELTPWSLTQVCSSWRNVAINHAPLWASFAYNAALSDIPMGALKVVLQRAREKPLQVKVIIAKDFSRVFQASKWMDRLKRFFNLAILKSRIQSLQMAITPPILHRIFCDRPHHWSPEDLNIALLAQDIKLIIVPCDDGQALATIAHPKTKSETVLRKLEVTCCDDTGLVCTHTTPQFSLPSVLLLTHLHLNFETGAYNAWRVLEDARNLLSFRIGLRSHTRDDATFYATLNLAPIHLPSLQDLDITLGVPFQPDVYLSIFLKTLRTPSLITFRLSYTGGDSCTDVLDQTSVDYLKRCSKLAHVTLIKLEAMDVQTIVASCPALRFLDIETCEHTTEECNAEEARTVKRRDTFGLVNGIDMKAVLACGHVGTGEVEERMTAQLNMLRCFLSREGENTLDICVTDGRGTRMCAIE